MLYPFASMFESFSMNPHEYVSTFALPELVPLQTLAPELLPHIYVRYANSRGGFNYPK